MRRTLCTVTKVGTVLNLPNFPPGLLITVIWPSSFSKKCGNTVLVRDKTPKKFTFITCWSTDSFVCSASPICNIPALFTSISTCNKKIYYEKTMLPKINILNLKTVNLLVISHPNITTVLQFTKQQLMNEHVMPCGQQLTTTPR